MGRWEGGWQLEELEDHWPRVTVEGGSVALCTSVFRKPSDGGDPACR